MDRLLYIAMAGAAQLQKAQAVNNNNLANLSTTGFRADLETLKALPVRGPGYATRVYAQADASGVDMSEGSTMHTGRDLDIAINGPGWIAVQAKDGTEAYTRAGDLKVSQSGQLLTAAGDPVLGNGGPIAIPPAQKIEIGDDGTISVLPLGQQASTMAVVDRIKLVNPPPLQLVKNAQGLLHLKNGGTAPADAAVKVTSGALEGSNVNPVEAMVRMIELSRQYEMQVNVMKSAKDNDAAATQILSVSG
jgi:flagellar basal-body rod protein FlgF